MSNILIYVINALLKARHRFNSSHLQPVKRMVVGKNRNSKVHQILNAIHAFVFHRHWNTVRASPSPNITWREFFRARNGKFFL